MLFFQLSLFTFCWAVTCSVVVGNVQGVWHKPRAQECSPQAYKASDGDIYWFLLCEAFRLFVIQLHRAQPPISVLEWLVDFMKYFSADFLSVKTRRFSLHIFSPFLAIDNNHNIECNTYRYLYFFYFLLFYWNNLTNLVRTVNLLRCRYRTFVHKLAG